MQHLLIERSGSRMICPGRFSIRIVTMAKYHRSFGTVKAPWKEEKPPDLEVHRSGYFPVSPSVREDGPDSVCPRAELPSGIQTVLGEQVENGPPGHVEKFEYVRPFLDPFPLSAGEDPVPAVPGFVKSFLRLVKTFTGS